MNSLANPVLTVHYRNAEREGALRLLAIKDQILDPTLNSFVKFLYTHTGLLSMPGSWHQVYRFEGMNPAGHTA